MKPTRYTQEMIKEYMAKGYWDDLTWSDIYDQNAARWPGKEAFVDTKERITWAQLKQRYDRFAWAFLEMGLKRDDMIICQVPNCIDTVALRIALEKAGLIYVFGAMNVGEAELSSFIERTGAVGALIKAQVGTVDYNQMWQELRKKYPVLKYIFVVGEEVPEGTISIKEMIKQPLEEKYPSNDLKKSRIDPNEVSQIMATTGTTGLPKLVEFTANCTKAHGKHYLMRWKISHDDSAFITAFLWTGPSMAGIYAAPQVGAKCHLMERFDPEEAMQIIERERPTYFTGFPVHLIQMARHPNFGKYKVDSFHLLAQGGAPFPQGMGEEIEQKFNAHLLTYYGSLDSLLTMGVDMDAPKEVRYTSVGKVHPWGEVKLLDDHDREVPQGEVGVVYCRGPFGAGGYFKDPEMTVQAWGEPGINGWFNMEDLGRMDAEGNVMLVGRKKNLIQRGGQNVYPAEIEGFLNAYPKILNVCVVPMPDPALGEKACAYVIPRPGETITLEEVTDYLLDRKLAKYKLPERIELVQEFPMLGDKVNKRALAEDIAAKLEAAGTKQEG